MTRDDELRTNSELDWQAFRYIAGEMAGPEAAAFESQLAEDQLAREAVTRAVDLTETVSACHFELDDRDLSREVELPSRGRRSGWWSAVVWASLGAAAALLLVLGLSGVRQDDSFWADAFPSQSGLQSDLTGELADVWSETRESLIVEGELADGIFLESGDDADLNADLAPFDAELLVLSSDDDSEGELTAPEWMLAALEDLAIDDSDNSEGLQTP